MQFNEYVISLYDFNLDGDPLTPNEIQENPNKAVNKNRGRELARATCKNCWGRGTVLIETPNNYMIHRYCNCVITKLDRIDRENERAKGNNVRGGYKRSR